MSNSNIEDLNPLLADLNPQQKVAVLSEGNSLRIIAGAGTGKTKVLTRKISYLVKYKRVEPEQIVALTFTNKASVDMKNRIREHIGNITSRLRIHTFYTLCAEILSEDSEIINISKNFTLLNDKDIEENIKIAFLQAGISEKDITIKFARRYILHSKLNDFFDSQLLSGIHIPKEELKKLDEMTRFYTSRLRKFDHLDHEDLLIQTHRLLTQYPEITKKWAKRFKHILVDEFQDINIIQHSILQLLSTYSEVNVVGDPDQTIYSWLGADVNLFLNFDNVFENVKTIMLIQNYRSTAKILHVANKLISVNKKRFDKNLFTENEDGYSIEFNHGFNAEAEARWIISKINHLKKQKIQLKNIAILYRSNFLLRALEQQLIIENINHIIYGGVKFYDIPEIKEIMWFLKVLLDGSDIAFSNIINVPTQRISPELLNHIIKEKDPNKNNGIYKYLLKNHKNIKQSPKEKKELLNFLKSVVKFKKVFENEGSQAKISYLLDNFLISINYYKHLEKHVQDEDEAMENIKELYIAIDKWQFENPNKTLREWFEYVSLFSENEEINKGNNYISLMTVHNSKGLEYENVFLMGLSEGIFPAFSKTRDAYGREDIDKVEEERRLAYVAVTRAKKRLFISDSRGVDPRTKENKKPSRFITEMDIDLNKHVMDIDNIEAKTGESSSLKNIEWVIGDHVSHRSFGEGEVIDIINNEELFIKFQKHGIKSIKKTHESIRRVSSR
ncbi:DNA helicase-2/ATP-dependent DNA helicase PcrA [Mycoplasma testudineum]|uniref:DNA 3'-5' helicase n=1 Tax=Mycoplasma testudineum TaxID=244584 RepID=A0A4R6IH89_9MOLU|nr:ATP-dependent helicase [Mycoplasma testudineum]OYD26870.1 ATP-dependent DNA helicase PcrA [Mycoplasma testudineum]TDO20405.1 DNA helicase-2/ATP-dependent DNA helicase PcrA [Mycoplasma testudineum]